MNKCNDSMHNLPATDYTQSTPQGWSSRGGGMPRGGDGGGGEEEAATSGRQKKGKESMRADAMRTDPSLHV